MIRKTGSIDSRNGRPSGSGCALPRLKRRKTSRMTFRKNRSFPIPKSRNRRIPTPAKRAMDRFPTPSCCSKKGSVADSGSHSSRWNIRSERRAGERQRYRGSNHGSEQARFRLWGWGRQAGGWIGWLFGKARNRRPGELSLARPPEPESEPDCRTLHPQTSPSPDDRRRASMPRI